MVGVYAELGLGGGCKAFVGLSWVFARDSRWFSLQCNRVFRVDLISAGYLGFCF